MKLKTFKQIIEDHRSCRHSYCNLDKKCRPCWQVIEEDTKQLVIKWIKNKFKGKSTHGNCCSCTDCKNYHDECKCDIIKEFKEFFNITEEDLK